MKTAAGIIGMLIRIFGLALIVLGVLFWVGSALALIPIHMLLGLVLVLLLWALAVLAGVAGAAPGYVALAFVWGLVLLVFGMTQARLLPGGLHWIIQVLHLVLGLGAIGLAETLTARMRAGRGPIDRKAAAASI